MESSGTKDRSHQQQQKKNNAATTTFGLIRRGNASDTEKMKPHFFRVMLDFMLKDAKIYIPTEFAKRHRSRLGTASVTLKVDNGETWEVEMVTDNDGLIWLVKGWESFTKHHSLKQGDILVFRLEQDSLFRVMVFEPTASEKIIKYANRINSHGRRASNEVKAELESREELEIPERRKDVAVAAAAAAASTRSENPSFSITVYETHKKRNYVRLPAKFVFAHMVPEKGAMPESRAVMVSGEEEGLRGPWILSFLFQPRRDGGRGQGSFAGGWPTFCRENSLKPGDVCRFELVSDGRMKVTVRRG